MIKNSLFQHQQQQQEENMSNLTSASGEAASVSSGNRNDTSATNFHHHQYFAPPPPPQSQPPLKKKRNLPGNPDPESEVIALSPKTLMATNRFVCEICNKGFQRDQNLQLHRRGHNLPWKLKQRSKTEVIRRKVYVCPEVSCVHNDPARALGDLTGIKKHFCRKHGEKKWKCEKCSKRYAVQSDWKAHSKVCGTREYRCDCGTLFSRRDSFITHRAFCDALAEESSRAMTGQPNPLLPSHQPNINLQIPQFNTHDLQAFSLKKEQESFTTLRPELPPWLACPQQPSASAGPPPPPPQDHPHHPHHHQSILQELSSTPPPNSNPNPNLGPTLPHYQTLVQSSPHMSATALLQKAAQMGATMSSNKTTSSSSFRPHHHILHHVSADSPNNTTSAAFALNLSSRDHPPPPPSTSSTPSFTTTTTTGSLLQEMMNSLSNSSSGFDDAFVDGVLNNSKKDLNFTTNDQNGVPGGSGGTAGEGLTRDFLGLRAFSHSDILSMAGLGNCVNTTSHEHQQHNPSQKTWGG
ncbi:protein indeterminate-domain 7 [Euphorbia lathyris]|uniref:protein indeterminate-domain 7 n=1 Tax=Euphorbia lathyris TaxID=212925 RepID=UPI003313F15B